MKANNPKGYWNYDRCYQSAKDCSSRSEFRKKYSGAYKAASKNGWLDTYNWFETPIPHPHTENDYVIYSYEDRLNKCVYVGLTYRIKKRHYEHKTGQLHNGVRVFDTVAKYFQSIGQELPNPVVKMDGLYAKDAQYYENWYADGYKRAGWTVLNKGKTGENSSAIGDKCTKWTYEKCKEEASKYKNRNSFHKYSKGAYAAAWENGWLSDFFGENTQKPSGYWTRERCYDEAKKYTTRVEFQNGSGSAYGVALKNKWIDDYTWFVQPKKPRYYWNYERCFEEAKKYSTRWSFFQGSCQAAKVARKNKWIDDYYWFLSKSAAIALAKKDKKRVA